MAHKLNIICNEIVPIFFAQRVRVETTPKVICHLTKRTKLLPGVIVKGCGDGGVVNEGVVNEGVVNGWGAPATVAQHA